MIDYVNKTVAQVQPIKVKKVNGLWGAYCRDGSVICTSYKLLPVLKEVAQYRTKI